MPVLPARLLGGMVFFSAFTTQPVVPWGFDEDNENLWDGALIALTDPPPLSTVMPSGPEADTIFSGVQVLSLLATCSSLMSSFDAATEVVLGHVAYWMSSPVSDSSAREPDVRGDGLRPSSCTAKTATRSAASSTRSST